MLAFRSSLRVSLKTFSSIVPSILSSSSSSPSSTSFTTTFQCYSTTNPRSTNIDSNTNTNTRVYAGGVELQLTTDLEIFEPENAPGEFPVFRLMDEDGSYRGLDEAAFESHLPEGLNEDMGVRMYRTMIRLETLDTVFQNAQRQGRISFYMTSAGEEATHIGSASALNLQDVILAQYRETGILMWRGFTLQQFADQCFSNSGDLGKGRQMPVHYGSKALNFHTISSPLTTQLPQASGVAYAMKMKAKREGRDRADGVTVVYFGDGAASEGDFHAALNIAATLEAPVIFFCRNNGFAISTPVRDQYRGDGIVSRAKGYGIPGIRVDGNDLFAVHAATKAAKELALSQNRPVFIETMSYRVGHHSTSDDSTRYRSIEEIQKWQKEDNPINRFGSYLEGRGWMNEELANKIADEERINVLESMEKAEQKGPPELSSMFEDVYKEKTRHLEEQEEELLEHVKKYPQHYNSGH